jgi:hypothetical protein
MKQLIGSLIFYLISLTFSVFLARFGHGTYLGYIGVNGFFSLVWIIFPCMISFIFGSLLSIFVYFFLAKTPISVWLILIMNFLGVVFSIVVFKLIYFNDFYFTLNSVGAVFLGQLCVILYVLYIKKLSSSAMMVQSKKEPK